MRLESNEENIRDLAPTGVRIPSGLKKSLKEKSKENNRSMNAEIVARLEESFAKELPPWEKESTIKKSVEKMDVRDIKELLVEVVKAIEKL